MDSKENEQDEDEKNIRLYETFQQQLYKMEMDKSLLRKKLTALEQDYSIHVNELKTNISDLHADIKKQKDINKNLERSAHNQMNEILVENEKLKVKIKDDAQKYSGMEKRMNAMQIELAEKRDLIQKNLKQLEEFKHEIMLLRKENDELEQKISLIIEERDLLYQTLQDSSERVQVLEDINKRQADYITNQQNEIYQLELSAADLQERLRSISIDNSNLYQESSSNQTISNPTHSLMAELQQFDSASQNPSDQPYDGTENDFYEMDDEALIAYIKANEGSQPSNNAQNLNNAISSNSQMLTPQIRHPETLTNNNRLTVNSDSNNFLDNLRLEVLDIFQQMRQMCVEISSKTSNQTRDGYCTPEELAFVEMNFRLGSLRGVLSDLRSMLTELSVGDNAENYSRISHMVNSSSIRDLQQCYQEQLSVAEKKANKLTKLNRILGESNQMTEEVENIPSTSDDNPEEIIDSIRNEKKIIEEQKKVRSILQRELETYQNDLQELRERIQQLSEIESQSNNLKLPDIDLTMTLQDFDDDEKYEFD